VPLSATDAALRVRELARYLDVLSVPGGADSGADDGGCIGGGGGGNGGGGSSGDGSGGGWIAALDRRIAEQPPPPRRPPALLSDASPAPPAPPAPTAPTAPTAPPELPGEGSSDATGGAPPPAKQPRLSTPTTADTVLTLLTSVGTGAIRDEARG
jgi:hypothetical protein